MQILPLKCWLAAKQEHDRIKGLVRADACRLPFADGRFNVVYTSRCLINVLDSDHAIFGNPGGLSSC